MITRRLLPLLGLAAVLALAGCSKHGDHGHSPHHHAHTAPHGGTLVELGDHQFNLEFVRDREAGTLKAYVLDGHAENFVRLPAPGLALVATLDGQRVPLMLLAMANPATGETVGNTSEFVGTASWLKGPAVIDAEIERIDVRGAVYYAVKFQLP